MPLSLAAKLGTGTTSFARKGVDGSSFGAILIPAGQITPILSPSRQRAAFIVSKVAGTAPIFLTPDQTLNSGKGVPLMTQGDRLELQSIFYKDLVYRAWYAFSASNAEVYVLDTITQT